LYLYKNVVVLFNKKATFLGGFDVHNIKDVCKAIGVT